MKGKLTKLPRAEQWADRICTQLGKSVESIIEVGRLLVRAKGDLAHGEWGRLFDEGMVPFGQRMADMFMRIASNSLLANSHNYSNLPPAVFTLHDLTRSDQSKLKNALKDGLIKPDMKRRDITALLPPRKTRKKASKTRGGAAPIVEPEVFSPAIKCFFDVESRLTETFADLGLDDQLDLLGRLKQLIGQLELRVQRTA